MKKGASKSIIPSERIDRVIYVIRDTKVMLDEDLATLYGVETKVLNQAVQRNLKRFPSDFAFKLEKQEWENLKSQFVTSSWGGRRKLPYAFTEQGVAMLSSVLRSPQAVMINIEIIRAFMRLRQALSTQKEMVKEITDLKEFVLKLSHGNNREFQRIWQAIEKLSRPPLEEKPEIGFDLS